MSFDVRASSRGFGYDTRMLSIPNFAPTAPAAAPTMTPDAFIAAHTTVDTTLPVSEECPICIDNYAHETCLLITGIPGCTHHIGETCLRQMLSSQPAAEKRCPLCRTVWIAAAAARARVQTRPGGRPGIPTLPMGPSAFSAAVIRSDENAAPQLAQASRATIRASFFPPPGYQPPQTPAPVTATTQVPQLITIDSDSEPDDYAGLTRDIENVRARARSTQLSRGQRRQTLRAHQASRNGHGAGANTTSSETDEAAKNRSLFGNVFRQNTPVSTATGSAPQPACLPAPARPSQAQATKNGTAPRATSLAPPRVLPSHTVNVDFLPGLFDRSTTPAPHLRTRPTLPPRTSSLRQPSGPGGIIARRPTGSRAPHLEVEIPPISPQAAIAILDAPLDAATIRETSLNAREAALKKHETALVLREAGLNDRDSAQNLRDAELRHREIALQQRELKLNAPNEREEAVANIVHAQRTERENLARRQKEEMERLIGD